MKTGSRNLTEDRAVSPMAPASGVDGTAMRRNYLDLLEPWPQAIQGHLYKIPGKPELGCFGPGHHGHWAMQANNTAASALAVLGMDPQTDFRRVGMSRDEILDWALRLIRFTLSAHHANGGVAADLRSWGCSWISSLSLERMMHGMEAIESLLTDSDREMLRRALIAESDWLVDGYRRGGAGENGQVTAGLVVNNNPESNIWNGCVLTRTALLYPDTSRCGEYIDQGTRFLLNGISLDEDASSDEMFLGRPLSEWHVGANFFPSYALNHHGYLNVGYMAICLSNIAMMHFSCLHRGWEPPKGLYHHARGLWRLLKTCTYHDGRLMRIGGDTRVRYCYCQDYAVPVWLWARHMLKDADAAAFELGWIEQVREEVESNPDDTFLSGRLSRLGDISPLYYTRLEGDRAASLSMGACWHRRVEEAFRGEAGEKTTESPSFSSWSDDHHHACLVSGERRTASWTWLAAEKPQGACLPSGASSMAESRYNLASRICGIGILNDTAIAPGQCEMFDGGFATCGAVTVHSTQPVSEGDLSSEVACVDIACAALPDDATMVIMQRARALGRVYLRECKGLFLQIPNDLFNGMRREYRAENGSFSTNGCPGKEDPIEVKGSWLEVEGAFSVNRIYGPELSIYRPADRQVIIRPSSHMPHTGLAGGSLYVDEICCGCHVGTRSYDAGEILFDLGVAIGIGPHEEEDDGSTAPSRPLEIEASDDVQVYG